MVHDSYGTHAADIPVMSRLLRKAFVDQYSGDVLGEFRNQMLQQLASKPELVEKIPPVPQSGSLDLTAVLNSDYFFA
jgi:DNA-directed RNA polymerase